MTCRAVCSDCGWTYQAQDRELVTDALERHAVKELHYVQFERIPAASV